MRYSTHEKMSSDKERVEYQMIKYSKELERYRQVLRKYSRIRACLYIPCIIASAINLPVLAVNITGDNMYIKALSMFFGAVTAGLQGTLKFINADNKIENCKHNIPLLEKMLDQLEDMRASGSATQLDAVRKQHDALEDGNSDVMMDNLSFETPTEMHIKIENNSMIGKEDEHSVAK